MTRIPVPSGEPTRLAALSGAVFFVLTMVTPDPGVGVETPSAAEVAAFYTDSRQDLQLAFLLTGAAYFFFLGFLAVIRTEFRRAGQAVSGLAGLVTGAGLLLTAFHVLGTALWAAPALQIDPGTDPELFGGSSLASDTYRTALVEISTFWRGMLLAGLAVLVLRSRVLPRWIGWLAAGLAAGALVGSISFVESPVQPAMAAAGFVSYVGFHVWVLLASLALVVRPARDHDPGIRSSQVQLPSTPQG